MEIIVTEDYESMSRSAAEIILRQVKDKPDSILGLATGSTPEGMYRCLIKAYEEGTADFSKVQTVNLDEYIGLKGTHPQSFRYYMDTKFFDWVNISKKSTYMPDGMELCIDRIADDYEKKLEEIGKRDIQILGIGGNGHIGFNEPADSFAEYVNVVELTEETIAANSRFFSDGNVPKRAVTMGIKDIMSAERIILMVSGSSKRGILKKALYGGITPKVPASILRLHPNLVVIADREAGEELEEVR